MEEEDDPPAATMDEEEKREILDWLNDDDEEEPDEEEEEGDEAEDVLSFLDTPPPTVDAQEVDAASCLPEEEEEEEEAAPAAEEEPVVLETSRASLDEGDEDELDRRSSNDPVPNDIDAKTEPVDSMEVPVEERAREDKKTSWDFARKLAVSAASTAAAARATANKSSEDLSSRASAMGAKMKSSLTALSRKMQAPTSKGEAVPPSPEEAASGFFSIGDDEDEEDGNAESRSPPPVPDPAALALAQHKIAGLRKGQAVLFDSVNLPDTVLFSAIKLKPMYKATAKVVNLGPLGERKLIRCIAVNRERFLVFDTFDQPVKFGAKAIVKSNHHLTELVKLTFPRARETDVIAVHLRAGAATTPDGKLSLKANTYKVPRADSLIKQLQDRLARFR